MQQRRVGRALVERQEGDVGDAREPLERAPYLPSRIDPEGPGRTRLTTTTTGVRAAMRRSSAWSRTNLLIPSGSAEATAMIRSASSNVAEVAA